MRPFRLQFHYAISNMFDHSALLPYNFSLVCMGVFNKYPSKRLPHIQTVDIRSRSVQSNCLITERIIGVKFDSPIPFIKTCLIRERSILDRKTKELTQISENLAFRNYFICTEKIAYKQTENGVSYRQSIEMDCASIFSRFTEMFRERCIQNSQIGLEALKSKIEFLKVSYSM